MLPRFISAGVLLLAGAQVLSAADPLIPPAPTRDVDQATPVPTPPAPHPPVPQPPAPALKNLQVLPVPEPTSGSPSNSITPAPTPVPDAATPQTAIPQTVLPPTPITTLPSNTMSDNQLSAGAVPTSNAKPSMFVPAMSGMFPQYGMPGQLGVPNGIPSYNTFSTGSPFPQVYQSGPAGGEHLRYPYYSYRRPWFSPGPASRNVNIVW